MCFYSCSEKHIPRKQLVTELTHRVRNMDDLCCLLEANNIGYEDYTLANGRMLLIFTGSSAYDVSGFSIMKKNNRFVIEDLYS